MMLPGSSNATSWPFYCWLSILFVTHINCLCSWMPVSHAGCQSSTRHQEHHENIPQSDGTTADTESPFHLIDVDLDALRLNLAESPALTIDNELLPNDDQAPRSIVQNVIQHELEASRQVDEIGARIKNLLELQKERRRQQIERMLQQDSSVSAKTSEQPPSDKTESSDTRTAAEAPEAGNEDVTVPEPVNPLDDIETTRILSEPPDQHALADSLYYSGESGLALSLYQNALQASSTETADKVWIQFQIACCFRRLQRYDEAATLLRQIVEGPESDPVVNHAKWWLDNIERKRQLADSITTLEQYIKRKTGNDNEQRP